MDVGLPQRIGKQVPPASRGSLIGRVPRALRIPIFDHRLGTAVSECTFHSPVRAWSPVVTGSNSGQSRCAHPVRCVARDRKTVPTPDRSSKDRTLSAREERSGRLVVALRSLLLLASLPTDSPPPCPAGPSACSSPSPGAPTTRRRTARFSGRPDEGRRAGVTSSRGSSAFR